MSGALSGHASYIIRQETKKKGNGKEKTKTKKHKPEERRRRRRCVDGVYLGGEVDARAR